MNESLDLAPELSHKERVELLKEMRKQDGKQPFWKVAMYDIKDVVAELNVRVIQYLSSTYTIDFRILQTVQDFQYLIIPLQTFNKKHPMVKRLGSAKVDYSKPVASLKNGKMIYFDNNVFTMEKPK